jgi:MerR family transcriptional regulator, mercuric resistance operon regulatory protein
MTDHERESGLTRGGLARATGCNIETIRYYEKTGLLPDPPRTDAGYRIYSVAHVTRLRFLLRARELGFSMADIRDTIGSLDR